MIHLLIVLAVALVVAMSFKKSRTYLLTKLKVVETKGSAFVKIAEADAKELEVKGRIIAIDAATKAKAAVVKTYEAEAARVHADADKLKADYDAVLAKL